MQKNVYAIEYPFAVDHGLKSLAIQTDFAAHVEQLMKQVLFTNPGERINRPDFGCGIRRMVFAPNSQESASLVQVTIYQAMEKWLGTLVTINQVDVSAEDEVLSLKINYTLKARQERRYLNVEVSL